MDAWSYQHGVQLDFIRPGRPVENSYIESFNGRLRDECLNVEVFFALSDVRDKLARWREDYNQVRPHSALADYAPAIFAQAWQQTLSSAAVRTAGPADPTLAGAVQCTAASDPKPLQLFGSPVPDMKGEAEKLLSEVSRPAYNAGS